MKRSSGLFDNEIATALIAETRGRTWHSQAALSLCADCTTDDPAVAIQTLARALVEDSGLRRPAENLPLLASLQDISAIEPHMMADAGRLVPTETGLVIHVNANHSRAKQRFSACHEITHTLIPSFYTGSRRKTDASTGLYTIDAEEEYLCDLGASEILLPTNEVLAAMGSSDPSVEILITLAADFGASFEATAIKIVRLGSADFALIVWEPSWKPTQAADMAALSLFNSDEIAPPPRKLRVRYACCSGSMACHYFPSSKSIDDGSLVEQAMTTDSVIRGRQDIMTGRGVCSFRTESLRFRFTSGDTIQQKVISLIFPG